MTPAQIKLARHALGLPNRNRKSSRNRFFCGPGHADFDNWAEMAEKGLARRREGSAITGGDKMFWLTHKAAKMALLKGERLDREDFGLKMPAVRAFAVTEDNENTGSILFAKHAIVARREGADRYNDGEFYGVSCRRAPWADHCAETGIVPAALCIEHGWHFECTGCGQTIDEDWLHENELTIEGVIGSQHSSVFCCAACQTSHIEHERQRKEMQEEGIAMLTAIIVKRFPAARVSGELGGSTHAYARNSGGTWSLDQVKVGFSFPGSLHGPAWLLMNLDHSRIGPVQPEFRCCFGDQATFEAWAASAESRVTA